MRRTLSKISQGADRGNKGR